MSGWSQFTVETVKKGMPTEMDNLSRTWVDANPAKSNRLAEHVAETLASFRKAVRTQSWVIMDEDPDTIPATGIRHALNMVFFNLGMEMGVQFAPEVYGLNVQANIWLRMAEAGSLKTVEAEADGTPTYKSERHRER